MKIDFNRQRAFTRCCFLCLAIVACEQSVQAQTYTTPVAGLNGATVENMVYLDYAALFVLQPDWEGGIIGTVQSGGKAELSVYAFDPSVPASGKGKRIYYSYTQETTTSYASGQKTQQVTARAGTGAAQPFQWTVQSNDLKSLALDTLSYQWTGKECTEFPGETFSAATTYSDKFFLARKETPCAEAEPVFYNWRYQPVIIEVKLTQANFEKIKIPGIGELDSCMIKHGSSLDGPCRASGLLQVYNNPGRYPDYTMIAAHRGYWRDVPENSMAAVQAAIDFGVDMVEIDVRKTADGHIVVAHDIHIGRLTNIPDAISLDPNVDNYKNPTKYGDRILISKLPLSKIRPDLSGGSEDDAIWLLDHNGIKAEVMPTLEEVLLACKGKVLVDIDKIEGFYYDIYEVAVATGTLDQVIVKGRHEFPDELFNSLIVPDYDKIDWKKLKFTPVYFADFQRADGSLWDFNASIHAFMTDSRISCPGAELIYVKHDDLLLPFKEIIEGYNKRVIQFPQFPENVAGVYNPKQFFYSDVDPRADLRNNWDWLLNKKFRPGLIISDRLEVLVQLMKELGLRHLPGHP